MYLTMGLTLPDISLSEEGGDGSRLKGGASYVDTRRILKGKEGGS